MEFETIIGLETHVQLATASKIFCGSSTQFGADPNHFVDPVTMGFPGCLPVLNKRVVEYAIMLGLALKCEIRSSNRFARKHYFYPDLPKGYQISQFEEPICERGSLEIKFNGGARAVGITRIHMEEDAGKNIHDSRTRSSLIDLNRAGVPLLEVVSEPDLRSPAEAAEYLRTLRQVVRYLGISDGNMEEGSLRCDANISLRSYGEVKFGARAEIKNINSFKFVEKALEYEVARQTKLLKSGQVITQETRLFDSVSETTQSMRGKEESSDYRYFPDPDLPVLLIEESWIRDIRGRMPKLPEQARVELVEVYGLSDYDAGVLTAERACVDFFMQMFEVCSNAKASCNWLTSELFGALKRAALEIEKSPISASQLGELIKLIDSEVISGKMAKSIFEQMFQSGKSASELVEQMGMKQITDPELVLKIVHEVFAENQTQLTEYLNGNDRIHPFFVGQVMKRTKGSASPKLVNELISAQIGKLRLDKKP